MNVNDDLDTTDEKLSAHEAYCARQRLAREQAALFPTRLAMARWRSGGPPHLHPGQPAARAAWYARTISDHQDWLHRGGFAQHDELAPLRQPIMWQPPRASASQRGLLVSQKIAQYLLQQQMGRPVEQRMEPCTQQNSQPLCRSDRDGDGDARQCGTCT